MTPLETVLTVIAAVVAANVLVAEFLIVRFLGERRAVA